MILSLIFIILDIMSVTGAFDSALPEGLNPFWKLATVFKCLCDSIVLDDFKTALDRLMRHKMRREGFDSRGEHTASGYQTMGTTDAPVSPQEPKDAYHRLRIDEKRAIRESDPLSDDILERRATVQSAYEAELERSKVKIKETRSRDSLEQDLARYGGRPFTISRSSAAHGNDFENIPLPSMLGSPDQGKRISR